MPPRRSTAAIDDGDAENSARRRRPFRPLQPHRTSRSPSLPTNLIDTPPREVILTPRATPKPIKRKALSRPKRTVAKVKTEVPEINLSHVRPPSPSDDSLLLSGTSPVRSPPLRARLTPASSSSPLDASGSRPSLSFTARLFNAGRWSDGFGSTPDVGDLHSVLPRFNAPRAVVETSSAWSDSDDDDGFNLTGEYTGKYKLLKVPTKADPPTRAGPWGRPVSPFPYSEIMERSLPLSELAEDGEESSSHLDTMDMVDDVMAWEVVTEPPPSDVELSPPPSVSGDEFAQLDDDFRLFDLDAESTQVRPLMEKRASSDQTTLQEEDEEAQIDRELSVAVDDGPKAVSKNDRVMEDGSSDEEDDIEGEDIIKITSDDPKAAARAAAILRMHDYDCILAAEKKKRLAKPTRKRRKTIENAGIIKSYIDSKSRSGHTLKGIEASPASRSLPLLELWRDAEDSVFLEHHSMSYCDTSFMLSPLKSMSTRQEPVLSPSAGEWTRDCWKRLDKCLVAERLAVTAARGLGTDVLANMSDVSKDAVLGRFLDQLGGESILPSLGPDWTRDNLMTRLDLLIKKQSRRATRSRTTVRQDPTQPRYRGLLQEAKAVSETTQLRITSTPTVSDMSKRHDTLETTRSSPDSPSLPSRQASTRDPIRTPSRTPDPRPPHPKDQVHLRHASVPPKSRIPVPIGPKRLVDLRHLSPTKADRTGHRPRRRSSGCSVKDLVRQFENLDK